MTETTTSSRHLVLFGDQAIDKLPLIQTLVRNSKWSPAARRFLQEATDVLQLEYARVSRDEHGWAGTIDSLLGIAQENAPHDASGTLNTIVGTSLTAIGRLGELVVHAERNPAIIGLPGRPVDVLAFCMGLLPAVALVAARDTSELFPFAREIVRASFRLGYAVRRRMAVMTDNLDAGGWSITYLGLQQDRMQSILDEFHEVNKIAPTHRIAIGIVSQGWLTLTGAPASMRRLTAWSAEIRDAPHVDTDVGGPGHTPWMPHVSADEIIPDSPLMDRVIDWTKVRMASPDHCGLYDKHATVRDLLVEIIEDILHNILRIDRATKACVERLDKEYPLEVTAVGTNAHVAFIQQTLKAQDLQFTLREHTAPVSAAEPDSRNDSSNDRRGGSDLVAIVGMGGRFPENETIDGFWEDLLAGECHIKKVPRSRFDVDVYLDAAQKLKNSTAAQHGAWLAHPGLFDHRFFNISPREAAQMDPVQRLFLTTSYEALEMAGYAPNATASMHPDRVATYFGKTGEDWSELLQQQGIDIYYVPSFVLAFAPSRVNYHYRWGGASYAIDAACASSTAAVTLACKALLARECDMALAGGASVLTSPHAFAGLSRSSMVSFDGGCRTFHDDADGYARGEGVGVVVLKRLEDAVADGDNVLGVVRGSARMYSSTSTSITHPSHVSQERIYREVLHQSGVEPEEVNFVEMHGTGTQAGDLEEMTSVLNALGGKRARDNPLTVGAVKAAVGHGEGAAGVTSLIKALLMLRERTIPAQPGWPFRLNQKFPSLDRRNVRIATEQDELRASPKGDGKIKVLVNSFDASGGNCALLIEEAPAPRTRAAPDPRSCHVVALSGRTVTALRNNRTRLLDYLERNPDTLLADLAYTTTARRMHEMLRVAYTAKSIHDLVKQLRDHVNKDGPADPATKPKASRVVLLFTGQGSQYLGMGSTLFETSPRFRSLLETFQLTATHLGLPDFLPIITDRSYDLTAASPAQVQLAIAALEIAVARTLLTWGIVPDAVVGHSLGEYAALCVAGVLTVADALHLVGRRALLMEKHLTPFTHAMLATMATVEDLRAVLASDDAAAHFPSCGVACLNAPNATVASGTLEDIEKLRDRMAKDNVRSTLLKVPFGFHSAQVEPVLADFREIAGGVTFSKPTVPVFSTLLGHVVGRDGSAFGPDYLTRQAREVVNFTGALRACRDAGFTRDTTLWVEVGPEPVCAGMVRKTLDAPAARVLPTLKSAEDNWATVSVVLKTAHESGLTVDWPVYHKDFAADHLRLLSLPTYAFDYKDFWTTYQQPPAWIETKPAIEAPPAPPAPAPPVTAPGFPSTTLHALRSETIDAQGGTVVAVFSTETAEPNLLRAIEGHAVNGHTICPLGVFADMAMSAARFCHYRLHKTPQPPALEMRDVAMSKAVVLGKAAKTGVDPITMFARATYSSARGEVDIAFSSRQGGREEHANGTCRVVMLPGEAGPVRKVGSELSQTLFLLKTRMAQLESMASTGQAHRLQRTVAYKLFSGTVVYSADYQGMDEVLLGFDSQDAVAKVTVSATAGGIGQFALNPYWNDTVTHLCGFVVNNGLRYGDDLICIALGLSEWRFFGAIEPGRTYRTYVCMQDAPGTPSHTVTGNCYVFDEAGILVQMLGNVQFQKLKKVALNHVVGVSESGGSSSSAVTSSARKLQTNNHNHKHHQHHHHHHHHHSQQPRVTVQLPTATIPAKDFGISPTETTSGAASSVDCQTESDFVSTAPTTAPPSGTSTPAARQKVNAVIDRLVAIVAAEIGCGIDEMVDEATFNDLGVDSLMAITIFSIAKNELGLDLTASFFLEHETVGAARQALLAELGGDIASGSPALAPVPETATAAVPVQAGIPSSVVAQAHESPVTATKPIMEVAPQPQASPAVSEIHQKTNGANGVNGHGHGHGQANGTTAATTTKPAAGRACKITHLQGPESADAPIMFLLADETGAAVSYIQLPSLAPNLCVYGVDWPAPSPDGAEVSELAELADHYFAAITAKQPIVGGKPFLLGGLSLGGVVAAEVARRLLSAGARVNGLLALDPPASPAAVEATLAGLSKLRVRPGQADRIRAAAALFGKHADAMPALVPPPRKTVVVLPAVAEADSLVEKWAALVPEVDIRRAGAESGKFFRFPHLNIVGPLCQDAVSTMNASEK